MQSGKDRNVRNVVAGFEVGSVIGIGTFGEVRYGRHIKTGARVALKIVDLSRFREDTAALLLKEIKILKLLRHKHVIGIHDVKDKVPYQGRWCEGCACTAFRGISSLSSSKDISFSSGGMGGDATRMEDVSESGSGGSLVCSNCGHTGHEHSAEETRHVLVMVQELAAGGELFGLLMHGGKFNEDIARYYFRQLIAGVEYCHTKGVVHRDLKPENLVLDPSFHLKIVDFGLASLASGKPRRVESVRPTISTLDLPKGGGLLATALAREREKRESSKPMEGIVGEGEDEEERDIQLHVMHSGVGSQPYSAPEVYYSKELYNGAGYRGQPADLWSCAVILFVMLTGRPPFLRPLTKTYGAAANMRRCKHFIKIMQGQGYGNISPAAKELLAGIFKLDPNQRLTLTKIKESVWFNGPVPDQESIAKVMEEKSRRVWAGLDKNEMVEVLRKMRAEKEEEQQQRHTEERILQVRNREMEDDEDDRIYTRTPRKHPHQPPIVTTSSPISIKPPTSGGSPSPISPRGPSAPIPIPTSHIPTTPTLSSSLLPSPSPLTPSASPSPLPSFSSMVPSSYNPLSEADVNVSLLSISEMEEPIYRSLHFNHAYYSHALNNNQNSNTHEFEKSSFSSSAPFSYHESSIPKSFSDIPTSTYFSYSERARKGSSPSSSPSHHSSKHRTPSSRSRKNSSSNSRRALKQQQEQQLQLQRAMKKFHSHQYAEDNMLLGTSAPVAPLYQEAWRALQGSSSPTQSEELILRRSQRRSIPSRKSTHNNPASSSSSSSQTRSQSAASSRSVFSLPSQSKMDGNIMNTTQKKGREAKRRHTSFSGKYSPANDQEELDYEPDEESITRPSIPSLPFASLGLFRCSRFISWSPLIRLLPTLASRLRQFGCTLVCQGLSASSTQLKSFREENGLLWTPVAKIRAVHLKSTTSSPVTCILTIFRLSLSEYETEKDEEGKWKDTQPLLVDCHRIKGDLLLWNHLFELLHAPIPDSPPSRPTEIAASPLSPRPPSPTPPSLSILPPLLSSVGSIPSPLPLDPLLPGVDHKGTPRKDMNPTLLHTSTSKELEQEAGML